MLSAPTSADDADDAAALRRPAERSPPARFAFPPGFNKDVRSFRINVDPPSHNIKQRPLFYYALTDGLLCGVVRARAKATSGSHALLDHPLATIAQPARHC